MQDQKVGQRAPLGLGRREGDARAGADRVAIDSGAADVCLAGVRDAARAEGVRLGLGRDPSRCLQPVLSAAAAAVALLLPPPTGSAVRGGVGAERVSLGLRPAAGNCVGAQRRLMILHSNLHSSRGAAVGAPSTRV